jgi:hypothetical protein
MPRHNSRSITLVGRASQLTPRSVIRPLTTRAGFTLTVKARGDQPPLVVECEGWGMKIREQFELMDEGSLVGIIGTMTKGAVGAMPLVRLDRLEYLGKPLPPLPVVEEEPEPQDWHDHPSLTAEERNPSLCR